jgi:hypothetical protein
MKTNLLVLLFMFMAAFMCLAPNVAAQATAYSIPTNLPGVTAAAEPPEWFNPLTASDADLTVYGFPPRPDIQTQPQAHKSWQKAMAAAKHSIVPELQFTNVFHGPARGIKQQNSTYSSNNWSGVVVESGATSFNNSSSFYYVLAEYVVPVASQAYGVCTGSTDYSSTWVGIDGFGGSGGSGGNDLFQAGTEADAYCAIREESQTYYAWYEWVPNNPNQSVHIYNLPISPGDDIWIQIWNTSATQGYAYILNYNTNQYVNLSLPAPSGTKLVGNWAEWIVERPIVNNAYSTLTNYIWDYFSNSDAATHGGSVYTPSYSAAYLVTMYSGSSAISSPTILGTYAIQLQNEGPSR